MSDLIKYGAIAAGGYLIYEYFFGTLFNTVNSAVATNNTTGQTQTGQVTPQGAQQTAQITNVPSNVIHHNAPTNTGATVDLSNNVKAIMAKTRANAIAEGYTQPTANYDTWNYYLQKPNGALPFEQSGLDPSNRDALITLEGFATILAQNGITGLGVIARGFSGAQFAWGLGVVNLGQYIYEHNPTALTRLGMVRPFSNESKLGFESR